LLLLTSSTTNNINNKQHHQQQTTTTNIQIEITNCFAVPHAERGDEVAIGKDFNKQMLQLHRKANRKEVVVGWYASTATDSTLVADTSSLIHDFYATETDYDADPVHVVVDTRLLTDTLQVKAYTSVPVTIQNEPIANLFHEISVSLESTEAERICLTEMQKSTDALTIVDADADADATETKEETATATTDENPTALLQVSMESLMQLLETTSSYVDDVVAGTIQGDAKVGRQIADTLAEVPRIRPAVFDRVFHEQLQDLLLVTYLSKITRTQLDITEKLHASLGI
jgi:translation initiation factor 3 subunit F